MTRPTAFATVRTEGSLLPVDLLQRLAAVDPQLPGLTPADFDLEPNDRLHEAISRSWGRLTGAWASFRGALAQAQAARPDDPATGLTRDRWLLKLFAELGYKRLPAAAGLEVDGRSYPISHVWRSVPIHLVGAGLSLDTRTAGVAGAARTSPHGLVQDFLNRSDDHLWAFVSNGLRLRVLRDNLSLTRQAFVELDLEAMMDGEVYADFALLWLLCHRTRVEAARPEECWLERWAAVASEQGVRALEDLRGGVEAAIETLGAGFLRHPGNSALRQRLRAGSLARDDYYRQLLRLVYRLLFLCVAEDRGVLLDPRAPERARDTYARYYSTARLRSLAGRRRGTRHPDLWVALRLVLRSLGQQDGCPALGLPYLGSFLFSAAASPALDGADLANSDLLAAVRALALVQTGSAVRRADFKNLGAEELGSVYESLLELHPRLDLDAGTFALSTASGHERKTTGSYYTPTSLITCLLESALDPVLDEAAAKPNPEQAILGLKVCDPACGSGHFLIAAGHRIARRLAQARTGDDEPSPEALRAALRDVVGHCLYGVDLNPMAVELAKVALWMEAVEPGKPLSFLDHHLKCGNSLLGATPRLLAEGIPDAAFEPIEGDDKAVCRKWKKVNREERESRQARLFDYAERQPWERLGDLQTELQKLEAAGDDTAAGLLEKERRYREMSQGEGYLFSRLWADAWCAAFVWRKDRETDYPITEEIFRRIERNPHDVPRHVREEVQRLALPGAHK